MLNSWNIFLNTFFFLTTVPNGILSKSLFCFLSYFKNFRPHQKPLFSVCSHCMKHSVIAGANCPHSHCCCVHRWVQLFRVHLSVHQLQKGVSRGVSYIRHRTLARNLYGKKLFCGVKPREHKGLTEAIETSLYGRALSSRELVALFQ